VLVPLAARANGGCGRRDAGPAARTGRRRFSALERKTLEMLVGLSDRDLTVEVFRITWSNKKPACMVQIWSLKDIYRPV
jgi:hypothetical protein